jgi:hypothetical protein
VRVPRLPAHWRSRRLIVSASVLLGTLLPAHATDLERGARLFFTPPAPGLLACMDCHSEDPLTNNFGNIFVGRNAPAMIQRAVNSNTGGMGVFRAFYDDAALADIAAWLGNSPSRVDFGEGPLGQTREPHSVTVRAGSKLPVSGLRFEVGGEVRLVATDCPATLPLRASCQVQLAFAPSAAGVREGWLAIAHDGLPTPAWVALTGTAIDRRPAVALPWPESGLAFGPVPTDRAGPVRALALGNGSAERLTLGAVEVDPALEAVGGSCRPGLVLGAGQRCELALRWRQPQPGPLAARVRLHHDGVGQVSEWAVSGTGLPGQPPLPAVDRVSLDFGASAVDTDSAPQTVTLANPGPQTMQLLGIDLGPGEFTRDGGSCTPGLRLLAGQRCTLQLAHRPRRAGPASAELLLRVAGRADAQRVVLQGLGVGPLARLTLHPRRLDWRAVPGQEQFVQAWVINRSEGSARLGSLALDGAQASDWALNGPPPLVPVPAPLLCREGLSLGAGGSCVVHLRTVAPQTGRRSARLVVMQDGGPLTSELHGEVGPGPWVEVDASTVEVSAGAAPARVTVRNASPEPLRWAAWQAVGDAASAFALGGSCVQQGVLAPEASCQIEVALAAGAPAQAQASLPLVDRDAGLLALLTLRGAASPGLQPPSARASLQPLDPWPETQVGGPPALQRLRLQATGPGALVLGRHALDGADGRDFQATDRGDCRPGTVLQSGESCEWVLAFHPSRPGWHGARWAVEAGGEWLDLPLQGRALGVAAARLEFDPSAAVLVATPLDPQPRQQVRLTNSGAASLWMGGFELTGAFSWHPGDAADDCASAALVLLPGQSCTAAVQSNGPREADGSGRWVALADDGETLAALDLAAMPGDSPAQQTRWAGAGLTGLGFWAEGLLALGVGLFAALRRGARS